MPDGLVAAAFSELAVPVLTGLLGWAASAVRAARRAALEDRRECERRLEADRDVVQLLLYYRLKDEYHVHIGKGEPMTPAARRDIDRMYGLYHDEYGGNGGGTAMYQALCELPIKG